MSVYATANPRPRDRAPPTKKRKFNRGLLLKGLEIIGSIQAPLAPELPAYLPSAASHKPTPSDSSFASSSKRKLDSVADNNEGNAKRAKPAGVNNHAPANGHGAGTAHHSSSPDPAKPTPPPVSLAKPASSISSKMTQAEKVPGEATNVGAGTSTQSPTLFQPVRRPRRGIASVDFKALQAYYHKEARSFKYSGEGRLMAAHPPNHECYKPLKEPPPKGSPYHTHSTLMAALELIEGLICFVYATWCQEHSQTFAERLGSWKSIFEYLAWVKSKWNAHVVPRGNVREKAFLGLIHMIDAFVRQRLVRSQLAPQMDHYIGEALTETNKARAREAEKAKAKVVVPPEKSLPSPDTDAASASSTPATQSNGTPVKPEDLKRPGSVNRVMPSDPPPIPLEPIRLPVSMVEGMQKLIHEQIRAGVEMKTSQKTLSLAIIREHFPHTYARMVLSTLAVEDEHEPDMEDGEGELLWPNQCVTGEGVAWVCLMGRAMTREFGKDMGYLNIKGIIPKPSST